MEALQLGGRIWSNAPADPSQCCSDAARFLSSTSSSLNHAVNARSCAGIHGVGISSRRRCRTSIMALDAAQPFDYESRKMQELQKENRLKIGIIGYGNFGQFLAQRLVQHGHDVLAHSRSDYSSISEKLGVSFFRDIDDFCEEHPEVVLLCTSILSTESVLRSLPFQRLKRSTLFVDVLSVKEFPKKLFLQVLPAEFDVLCTHPMFGPESGRGSWSSLPFVYEKVRIGAGLRTDRCRKFLEFFEKEGCQMVEMSCSEHDRYAASSQFITHTVGRILGKLELESTPINTKGYETLLNLVHNTEGDSFELYYGLFMYNVNATEELERLEHAFDSLKRQLFGKLHNVLRKQLFKEVGTAANGRNTPQLSLPASTSSPENGSVIPISETEKANQQ